MDEKRMEDALIFALGCLERLKAKGMIKGGKWQLGVAGQKRYEELRLAKFRPTDEEFIWALETIQKHVPHAGN